jgi:signal recognition particle subunit SRP54
MTMHERRFPKALNASRKRRISRGAGVHVSEINRLLKRFAEMQKMMKQFKKSNKKSSALNAIDGISTKISSKQQLQAMGNNLKNQDLSKIFKL